MTETIVSLLHVPPCVLGAFWHLLAPLPNLLSSKISSQRLGTDTRPGLATCREPLPATDLKMIINTLQARYLILWESNSKNMIFPINNPHMCVFASLSLCSLHLSLSHLEFCLFV